MFLFFRIMMSSEDELADHPDTPPSKKRRIKTPKRQQKFRTAWLSDVRLKYWLQKIPDDPLKAKCTLCSTIITADISALLGHRATLKHQGKENSGLEKTMKITNFVKPQSNPLDTSTKSAEIKIVGFLVDHNIAFNALEHLTDTLKSAFPDSAIAKNMNLKRTKGTAIATNIIGEEETISLVRQLSKTKFSILTDEPTDVGAKKTSCILVRYYDDEREKICSKC